MISWLCSYSASVRSSPLGSLCRCGEAQITTAARPWPGLWTIVWICMAYLPRVLACHHLTARGLFSSRAPSWQMQCSLHAFRHSFATRLLGLNHDARTTQNLLGRKDVNTTIIYTRVIFNGSRVISPSTAQPQWIGLSIRPTHAILLSTEHRWRRAVVLRSRQWCPSCFYVFRAFYRCGRPLS